MLKLIVFDVDGTLAETYTIKLLPRVRDFFHLVCKAGCRHSPALALATNQGGVGMRYWMEQHGFGNPARFPAQQDVEQRLHNLVARLGADPLLSVYASYRYQNQSGEWAPVPPGQEANPRWLEGWRKPQPGMLLQAMADAGVTAHQTLFVGDSADDQAAAQAAGCAFEWAKGFFAREWESCDHLSRFLSRFKPSPVAEPGRLARPG